MVYVISGRSHNTALLNFGSRLLFNPLPVQLGKLCSASGNPGAELAGAVTLLKGPFLGPHLAGAAATALQVGQEPM